MATSGEEQVEPLKYKKWVLKVSIHCEGCKKKVKKVLQNIDGVYTVEVDSKKHKAIVTCNVDVEVLLRKLAKAHKNAELWPDEPKPKPESIPTNTTSKDNGNKADKILLESSKNSAKNVDKNSTESDTKKEKPKVEDMKPNKEGENKGKKPMGNEKKDNKDNKHEEKCITEKAMSEKKVEKRIETEKEANEKLEVAKEKAEKTDNNESKNSKDEKQKENKIDNKSKQKEIEPQPQSEQEVNIPQQIMRNPYHQMPEPTYVVSYNTVRPSTSYGYYAPMPMPMPMPTPMQHEVLQHGYPYPMSYQPEGFYPHYPPPLPPAGVTLPPPDDGSYEVFSDENANACKLM